MSNPAKGNAAAFFILGLLILGGGIGGYVYLNKQKIFAPGKPGPVVNPKPTNKDNFVTRPTERTKPALPAIARPPSAPRPPLDPSQYPSVAPLTNAAKYELPYLLWGGDVAAFVANGGKTTTPGSIFAKHGLNLELVDGNDFDEQVKRFVENKTPFLRGTLSQLAQNCDKLGTDPKTRPVVLLQMTWSAGDHMVSREGLKTLGDIRGKKIALQKNGPHVGMLDDVLRTAGLGWGDITLEWTKDVTGPDGPAEKFRNDGSIDACFAITPDMTALTGGLDKAGTGQNGTVAGAHVLVSTTDMKRSIADVYACRKDFYDANRPLIDRFVAGYLKGVEELLALRREYRKNSTPQYVKVLKMTQDIFGKEAIPTEDDASGLIDDAVFVGLPGNRAFFDDPGNLSGYDVKEGFLLDFALNNEYVDRRVEFFKPEMDYGYIQKLGNLTLKDLPPERFRKIVDLLPENTIYTFTVEFQPDQSDFPTDQYGEHFKRALQQASLFGNAMLAIRGHADPGYLVDCAIVSGKNQGLLRDLGGTYTLKDGTPFDPQNIKQVLAFVESNRLFRINPDTGLETTQPLKPLITALKQLSEDRSTSVRTTIVGFANQRKWRLDESQIKAVGVGATEPVVAWPLTDEDRQLNRRVEFRIVRVPPTARIESESDIDY